MKSKTAAKTGGAKTVSSRGRTGSPSNLASGISTKDMILELPLDLIDEDPNQPRTEANPGFSKESLEELAATIGPRGVKSPISVRENPQQPGRYIINHGARRYRASKMASRHTIRAFIDSDYNRADQVIENLQRNELTAREIADYIGRELAAGKQKAEIAKELGKSAPFVSQHVTLLDLPEPIAEAFQNGRVKDVTTVNELVKAYKRNPREVAAWLAEDAQEITRGAVKLLRDFLERLGMVGKHAAESAPGSAPVPSPADSDRLRRPVIRVSVDGRKAQLLANRRPTAEGRAWVRLEDDGQELDADLSEVRLVAVHEA